MSENNQPTSPLVFREDGHLELFLLFSTIQGEGPYTGHPAIFIRLAGCNLQCPLCDTRYFPNQLLIPPDELVDSVESVVKYHAPGTRLVVITGGEPFRQNLKPVTDALLAAGFTVQIETNGTLYQELDYERITIVCSPKTHSLNRRLVKHITAFKYVVQKGKISKKDGLPTTVLNHPCSEAGVARPPDNFDKARIYVQPADEPGERESHANCTAAVASAKKFGYTLGLQLHKAINLP